MFKDYFKGIWKDRYVLASLVNQALQLKYKRSVLGVAWAILTPLGLVLIIGTVYTIVFGVDPTTFIPMLFAGLNTWLFISGAADAGAGSLLGAEGYLKQTTTSPQIFPLKVTLVAFVNLLYAILAFLAIYLFLKPDMFGPAMLLCVPGLLIVFLASLAMANIAAVAHLYYRDYQPLQGLVLQALFYATPIIFPAELLSSKGFEIVYQVNPFYYLIDVVRTPLLGGTSLFLEECLIASGISLVAFVASVALLMRHNKKLIFKF